MLSIISQFEVDALHNLPQSPPCAKPLWNATVDSVDTDVIVFKLTLAKRGEGAGTEATITAAAAGAGKTDIGNSACWVSTLPMCVFFVLSRADRWCDLTAGGAVSPGWQLAGTHY